jgi:limonene-1,2-epoxide hydrolase
MQDRNEMNLRRFIGEWGKSFEAAVASFRDYLSPGAVWEQVGSVTTHSADEAIALLHDMRSKYGIATFGADIRHLLVRSDVAVAKRVDHLRRADGTLIHSAPVTTVYEFDRDGKINAMREYFDTAALATVVNRIVSGMV